MRKKIMSKTSSYIFGIALKVAVISFLFFLFCLIGKNIIAFMARDLVNRVLTIYLSMVVLTAFYISRLPRKKSN